MIKLYRLSFIPPEASLEGFVLHKSNLHSRSYTVISETDELCNLLERFWMDSVLYWQVRSGRLLFLLLSGSGLTG